MSRSWDDLDAYMDGLRGQVRAEHEARGGRWPWPSRRPAVDEAPTPAPRSELEELRGLVTEAWTVSRVLRGQIARYEQLVQVDSWRGVVTVAMSPPLASCGHPRDEDGECSCAWWPERAPEAGQ